MKILQCVMVLFLATFLTSGIAFGQDEKDSITTDRPSFTTSPFTLSPGVAQLELGYTYRETDAGDHVGDFPQVLFRYGVYDKLELRAGWGGYSFSDNGDYANDMSLGLKWQFMEQDKCPAMGLIFDLGLPTGHHSNDVTPSLVLAASYDWKYDLTFSGNLGVAFPRDMVTDDRFTQGIFSLNVARPFTVAELEFNGYVEYFTTFPDVDDGQGAHSIGLGVTHALTENMQFDVNGGFGLSDEADDWFVGFGFAYRF